MDNQPRRFHLKNTFVLFFGSAFVFLAIGATKDIKAAAGADFDGDGKADLAVFRPSNGFWYAAKSSGGFLSVQWGLGTDRLVPGDYDGDGKTDIAVYRLGPGYNFPVNAADYIWYIRKSSDNTFLAKPWGRDIFIEWDTPVPADYDGDGKTDLAVYTLSDGIGGPGRFKVLRSSDDSAINTQWGFNTDTLVASDYDGDGKTDLAVYRGDRFGTEINRWFILQSSTNTVRIEQFGLITDWRVPSDYDGDGKTDLAVFRPSNGVWYRVNSRDNSFTAIQFGQSDDRLVPADYDGDGKTDLAVFRPSNGVWYLQRSTAGFAAQPFGLSGDVPIQVPR